MNNQITDLCGGASLIDQIELVLPSSNNYVDVSMCTHIRVSIFSTAIVKVTLEWSIDGTRPGSINMYRCGSGMWKNDIFDTVMPFLRIRVFNESGRPCDEVIVHTWSPGLPISSSDQSNVKGGKSPFKYFSKSERSDKPTFKVVPPQQAQIPARDPRLPDYIPQGCLLVGGDKGRITVIPKGNVGDHLVIGKMGPMYRNVTVDEITLPDF